MSQGYESKLLKAEQQIQSRVVVIKWPEVREEKENDDIQCEIISRKRTTTMSLLEKKRQYKPQDINICCFKLRIFSLNRDAYKKM